MMERKGCGFLRQETGRGPRRCSNAVLVQTINNHFHHMDPVKEIKTHTEAILSKTPPCYAKACPHCRGREPFGRHDCRRRSFRVVLEATVKVILSFLIRYKCRTCRKTFSSSGRKLLLAPMGGAGSVGQTDGVEVGVLHGEDSLVEAGTVQAPVAAGFCVAVAEDQLVDVTIAPDVLAIGDRGGRAQTFFDHLLAVVIEMPRNASGRQRDPSAQAVVTGMSRIDASGVARSGLPTKAPLPSLRRTVGRLLAALGWASDRRPAPTKATPPLWIPRGGTYKGGIGCGTETSARLLDATRTKGDVRQRAGRFQGLLATPTEPRARRRN